MNGGGPAAAGISSSDVRRDLLADAVARQAARPTPGIADMTSYLAAQVADTSHREVVGPLLPGTGASGVVVHGGTVVAQWGDPAVPEMCFSLTKSIVSAVAGVAFTRGLLDVDGRVGDVVAHPAFAGPLTWKHLLQQTSGWDGELWGKPTSADAQSGSACPPAAPGQAWAYNDVRVNLLCLALTALFGRSLDDVLRTEVLGPLGASDTWSWHGYADSSVDVGGRRVKVVSGGAHWGGGLWASARDLALLGTLHLDGGRGAGRQLLSEEWVRRTWQPCDVKADYGYLWWLNTHRTVFPEAPATGRAARGNGGRHLLWVDPARDLVVVSHWGEDVGRLLMEVSAAVPESAAPAG